MVKVSFEMNTREPLGSISRAFSRYQSESLGGNRFPLYGISEKRDTMKVLSSEVTLDEFLQFQQSFDTLVDDF